MPIPLEDQFQDVINKARRGLRLGDPALAQRAGVGAGEVESFSAQRLDNPRTDAKIASALGLHLPALLELARGTWHPGEIETPPTFAAYNVPFGGDMSVNFYLAWDREGGRAAAFDTGNDVGPLLRTAREHGLRLDAIFLTHTHPDHVADLDRLTAETDAAVYVSAKELLPDARPVHDGERFTVGALTVTARLTPGHSAGGMTYVIEGIEPMMAVVGDALFAGSMGGVGPEKYAAALEANRTQILSLPETTILCPGHGPLTTVAAERRHNPFYAHAGVQ